jgi:hypothetical protein
VKRFLLLTVLLTRGFADRAEADPPKLLTTSPPFWSTNVNAATQKRISLTFDQRLRGRLTDWIGLDVLSPPSDLQTTFSADNMSCSIAVHLAPGKVYICALNERGMPGVGFQNEKGFALPPTYLVFQTAGTPSPEDIPPHVVKSIPGNGAQQVDTSKVVGIGITFDQPMGTQKHGLHVIENGKAIDVSKQRFGYSPDGKTFTLAYGLKPAAQYRLELNTVSDIGFARPNRIPLWPVQISFSTQ